MRLKEGEIGGVIYVGCNVTAIPSLAQLRSFFVCLCCCMFLPWLFPHSEQKSFLCPILNFSPFFDASRSHWHWKVPKKNVCSETQRSPKNSRNLMIFFSQDSFQESIQFLLIGSQHNTLKNVDNIVKSISHTKKNEFLYGRRGTL